MSKIIYVPESYCFFSADEARAKVPEDAVSLLVSCHKISELRREAEKLAEAIRDIHQHSRLFTKGICNEALARWEKYPREKE